MTRYLSWSGGKDSSASIVVCYERGIPLDGIIFSEVMFDHSRNISGEDPEQIKWVYEVAIPTIKNMGYTVTILKSKLDYLDIFNMRISERTKVSSRIGKKYGWLIGGMCCANSRLKLRPIQEFEKYIGEHEQIIGIASDEKERLVRLKSNCRSVLAEYGIIEKDTYAICQKYGLLSPLYEAESRGGCWFCPNRSIKAFAAFKKRHPELWGELEKLSHDKELVSQGFKYGQTFDSVNRQIDIINNQISIFDIIEFNKTSRTVTL